jgi:ADP-ribosylglycohydrolase
MLWSAYGDALGFITEFCSKSGLERRTRGISHITKLLGWNRRIGGQYGIDVELPIGCYSDDTQLRLATSRSIRGDGSFDVQTFSKVELPVWLSYAFGAGIGTKAAAESLRKRQIQWNSNFFRSDYSRYTDGGGNGAAMRIQPHMWAARPNETDAEVLKNIVRNAVVTHGHSRAIVGAAFHGLSLLHTLKQLNIPDPPAWFGILEELKILSDVITSDEELGYYWLPNWEKETHTSLTDAIAKCLDELKKDVSSAEKALVNYSVSTSGEMYRNLVKELGCFEKSSVGSGTKTAVLALYLSYAFRNNPHDGLVTAANVLGSDTDTIATMAGAIMGATTSVAPPEQVADMEYLINEAERLFAISNGEIVESKAYPDMLYWQPPQTQLDVVGKYKDKWVIQGLGEAIPGDIVGKKGGRDSTVWQWFHLEFGQSVLIKRRHIPKVVKEENLPVKNVSISAQNELGISKQYRVTTDQTKAVGRQKEIWQRETAEIRKKERMYQSEGTITIDVATNICIQSDFEKSIVGEMLMRLSEQENGIEKAIGFAAIIAKAKQVRMKKAR